MSIGEPPGSVNCEPVIIAVIAGVREQGADHVGPGRLQLAEDRLPVAGSTAAD